MADGDIQLAQDGEDWLVTIEGIKGVAVRYETREEAVEAGRRVAAAAHSNLVLVGAHMTTQKVATPGAVATQVSAQDWQPQTAQDSPGAAVRTA